MQDGNETEAKSEIERKTELKNKKGEELRTKGKITTESSSKQMNNEQKQRMNCWTMTRNVSENWEKRQKKEGKESKNHKTNVLSS